MIGPSRPLFLLALLALLAGCAAPAPVAETSAPPIATPTPTPTVDPTVLPTDRYGLGCDGLASADDRIALFGKDLPFARTNSFGGEWTEALVQDRAISCRWGEGPYLDGAAPALSVTAAPYGRASFDPLVASWTPGDGVSTPTPTPTPVPGLGDAAYVNCSAYDRPVLSCSWAVVAGDTWIVVDFDNVSLDQADVTPQENYRFEAVPRLDSSSAELVARIVDQIAAAEVEDVAATTVATPACDDLADWAALATEFSLGEPIQPDAEPFHGYGIGPAVLHDMGLSAAERQGGRACEIVFGQDGPARATYVWLRVLPAAGWLGTTGIWPGWEAEDCHGFEGGPICELGGYRSPLAVHVRVGGAVPDGFDARVFSELTT